MDFLKIAGVGDSEKKKKRIKIRLGLKPGDIGYITYLHGVLHAREHNWNHEFEGYVAEGLGKYAISEPGEKDRIWIAELDGKMVGCIAIVKNSTIEAQLRWYLIHPNLRGAGLGKKLMAKALQFTRECGYKRLILWTTSNLEVAAHIYRKVGFTKTEEVTNKMWGDTITQEKYEIEID